METVTTAVPWLLPVVVVWTILAFLAVVVTFMERTK